MASRGPFLLSLGLSLLAACGVGDDKAPPSDPDPRVCRAAFTLAGTFTLGMPSPDKVNNDTGDPPGDGVPDIQGCWPVGTWTFTATMTDNDCSTPPTPLAEYKFTTTFVDDDVEPAYAYQLLEPDQNTTKTRLSVSSGGGGLCTGNIEVFNDDGTEVWNLQPALNTFNASGPLAGVGEFAIWKDSQSYP